MEVSGKVTRLADMFTEREVERASTHVQSALKSHWHTLQTLEAFLHDNQELIKLVQDLPSKVSHNIMVPCGKAAFFPGRLMHTNEFLVLLGEGYYAECSATQTLAILSRRGKLLDSQIAGVKSQLADLDVESHFFNETLAEAAAGCVEIREEFVESASSGSVSKLEKGSLNVSSEESHGSSSVSARKGGSIESSVLRSSIEDEEHELLMARLDELEAAEAAAELKSRLENDSDDNSAKLQLRKQDLCESITNARQKMAEDMLQANNPPQRAEIIDHGRVRGLTDSHKAISDGPPSVRSPSDILKFEEWKRCKAQQVSSNETERAISTRASKKQEAAQEKLPPLNQAIHLPQTVLQRSKLEWKECNSQQVNPNQIIEVESEILAKALKKQETVREKSSPLNEVAPLSPTGLKRSGEINKAFTGKVMERSAPSVTTEPSQDTKLMQQRPISKFKRRQTDL